LRKPFAGSPIFWLLERIAIGRNDSGKPRELAAMSTTIYTIWKETRSGKWTAVASLMPLAMGFALCFVVAQVWRLLA